MQHVNPTTRVEMPLPFYVSSRLPSVPLFELSDGRFQLVQQGPISPWMAGHGYLLVEKALANFLARIGVERIRQQSATIWNRATGEERETHVRLFVGQFFSRDQLHDLPLDGPRMLSLDDAYCFVSPDLKDLLEQQGFSYLQFSEGLSEFAAAFP